MSRITTTNKTALVREFLRSALDAREDWERQRERVESLEARCKSVTAHPSGLPGGGGSGPENLWAALADQRAAEGQLAQRAEEQRRAVERAILGVEEPAGRQILAMRYLRGLSWPVIREKVGCSERTVFRLHNRALEQAGKAAGLL